MAERCQAMFDARAGADFIEGVLAAGLPVFVVKRLVNYEPLSLSSLMILIGENNLSRRRKSTQLFSLMSP